MPLTESCGIAFEATAFHVDRQFGFPMMCLLDFKIANFHLHHPRPLSRSPGSLDSASRQIPQQSPLQARQIIHSRTLDRDQMISDFGDRVAAESANKTAASLDQQGKALGTERSRCRASKRTSQKTKVSLRGIWRPWSFGQSEVRKYLALNMISWQGRKRKHHTAASV
jgi:hypothetical protein